ncbi:plasmid recombination protein [Rhizobium sp. WSM4643]|uniref:plasmid recombination protein n=1 Tax=Rhizobium sp. WSM4643 TaxID=3138253 RepID=UPI0021A46DB4|nr:plasmid recombination protein [Rhizobium leguminosarum]UWM76061.1 plasmid recombination protein [Rhizobium leguminosarum bv. viciae]
MAIQFVHMENFSRKADKKGRSTSFVFGEAARRPDVSLHVHDPLPPIVIYGVPLEEVERLHDAQAATARTTPQGGKERSIQRHQHTLVTVVMSHPYTVEEVKADPAKRSEAERWEVLNVQWLKEQFGDSLASVVRHDDEAHYHLHAYALPPDRAMKASLLHPGQVAKSAVLSAGPRSGEDQKSVIKRSDHAYKAAMRKWQDGYHQAVAVPCGLSRLGPAKRRLTRAEWQAEKVQATALQATVERARAVQAQGQEFVAQSKASAEAEIARAAKAKASADRAAELARRERERAEKASAEALKARLAAEEAQRSADRLKGIGGRLRALFDGLRISKVREAVAVEFSARLEQAQRLLDAVRGDVKAERERRREAERLAEASASSVRALAAQRNLAWQEVQSLRARYEPEPTKINIRGYKPK